MPYDINQLSDMLVPELADVAERLKISNIHSMDKQTLIYKILDHQALENSGGTSSPAPVAEEKKRRGRKPKTAEKTAEEDKVAPAAKEELAENNAAANTGEEKRKRARKPRTAAGPAKQENAEEMM